MSSDRNSGVKTDTRLPSGRFGPGNPGKPPGARHRTTRAIEALLEGEAERCARKVVELALAGDAGLLKAILDRVAPARRGRPVDGLKLPRITGPSGVLRAHGLLLAALARGHVTPEEAELVGRVLQGHLKAIETVDIEKRITALEQRAGIR
jgi:hypothetical protein